MTIMTIAGDAFNVLVEGDADKPVLMISNPLGTNHRLWDPQMPALLEYFRVIRYDSRGHGDSVADEGPYSAERLGHDALEILDALGIDKVHWLGLSLGGIVGLWILAHAPGRIGRAVLANTAAQIFGPEVWNGRIEAARAAGMNSTAEIIAGRWFTETFINDHPDAVEPVLSMVRTTPLHGYLAGCAALRDTDLREAIRSITRPVLVIVGKHDVSTPPEFGTLVADSIHGARLVTLDAGHISNVEDEENFTSAVVSFLTSPEVEARPRAARGKKTAPKKMAARKAAAKGGAAKGKTTDKAPAKTAPRAAAAKAAAKKPATKKAATKKVAANKATAKTASVKKTVAQKTVAKKATAQKSAAKKATAQKSAAKKAVAAKAPAKKMAVKKAAVKKAAPKKTKAPVKAAAGKASAKKAQVKKAQVKKAAVKTVTAKTVSGKKRPATPSAVSKAAAQKGAAKKAPRKK
jgi:3-oxoadipate enol-lactonase